MIFFYFNKDSRMDTKKKIKINNYGSNLYIYLDNILQKISSKNNTLFKVYDLLKN